MSLRNAVMWSDGLFIKPQHLQQQQRYHDYVARRRGDALSAYQMGFEQIELNTETLLHGKIDIVRASGILPDRTVFEIPGETPAPGALDLSAVTVVNEIVYLAAPLVVSGLPEIPTGETTMRGARYRIAGQDATDVSSDDAEPYSIEVTQLNMRLMLGREDRSSFAYLPVCRVQEKQSDGSVRLDPSFMPTSYGLEAIPQLTRVLDDFTGLLHQRALQIAGRLGSLSQNGVAEIAEFLLLQTINRWQPVFRHLSTIKRVHPERLYEVFASSAGELATFTHEQRLPEAWPPYNHEMPEHCFDPLIRSLRRSLTTMLEPNAIVLDLHRHKFGVLTAPLTDPDMIRTCAFVLAVRAAIPLDRLAKTFPSQVKVSSIEKIRELVQSHLPGVVLQPMPTAPRQLPYHAGYTYFMLDNNSVGWKDLLKSSGFAFHIAGDFPDLEMQFWAIRGRTDGRLS
ncbi:type VI secretion system protein ImpJ [Methylobacterium sp. UNC300MFChir4.1]|nr:type VI secretion system protein ImpJ [Methylobacterium sp. UNC300MFChir4.1]